MNSSTMTSKRKSNVRFGFGDPKNVRFDMSHVYFCGNFHIASPPPFSAISTIYLNEVDLKLR